MVAHTLKPSSWEANAGGSLPIQGQPSLLSELQNSQNHLETLPQKERKKKMRGGEGCATGVITPFMFCCLICPRPYFNPHHYKQSRETKTKIVCNILRFFFLSFAVLGMKPMDLYLDQPCTIVLPPSLALGVWVQAGLELKILMSYHPECWYYRPNNHSWPCLLLEILYLGKTCSPGALNPVL